MPTARKVAATRRRTPKHGAAQKADGRRWSQRVTRESNALDLDARVFTWSDPKRIARSLKRSAESSRRRKGTARQSAMSMLNFYLNRGGKNLTAERKRTLAAAKEELKRLFEARGE